MRKSGNQQTTSFVTESITQESRQSWTKICFVWLGMLFCVATMMQGGVVGTQLPLGKAMAAILCANTFLALLTIAISFMGADTGLGAFELLKYPFGVLGGKIVSLARTVVALGWCGFGAILLIDILGLYIPFFQTPTGFVAGGILLNLFFAATAWFSFKALAIVTRVAVPAIVVIFAIAMFRAESQAGIASLFALEPVAPASFVTAVAGMVFVWIDCCITGPNITRFSRSKKDSAIAVGAAFIIGASVMYAVSAILGAATGKDNIPDMFNVLGIAGLAGIVIFLLEWTTSSESFYHGALGFASAFPIKSRGVLIFLSFAVSTAFTLFDLMTHFGMWVDLLGLIFCPVIGLMITDYYGFRRKYQVPADQLKHRISWSAVIAIAVGVATNVSIPVYGGLLSIATTAVSYYVVNRFLLPDAVLRQARLQESKK